MMWFCPLTSQSRRLRSDLMRAARTIWPWSTIRAKFFMLTEKHVRKRYADEIDRLQREFYGEV